MAFNMDGFIIDRIEFGVAEDFSGNILYTLSQLQDASIDITSDSKESKDARGVLIKKFYTGKSGTFTATNALVDFNIMAASSGSPKQVASSSAKITMPRIVHVKKGTKTLEVKGVKEGTVRVVGLSGNDSTIKTYKKNTAASETQFSITGITLTLPTDDSNDELVRYLVKYEREVENGISIKNKADKYPSTIKLTLKALAVDPCATDTLRACYIVLPSFQVSADTSIKLATDATLEYKGDLQVAYCDADKTLYEIYFAEDDVEEE